MLKQLAVLDELFAQKNPRFYNEVQLMALEYSILNTRELSVHHLAWSLPKSAQRITHSNEGLLHRNRRTIDCIQQKDPTWF